MSVGTWARENPLLAIAALVFGAGIAVVGIVFGFVLLVVLAVEAPLALGALLLVLLLVVGLATRSRLTAGPGMDAEAEEPDPLTELERRYVAGEMDDEEFEHRLSMILDAEERAGRDIDASLSSLDTDLEFER